MKFSEIWLREWINPPIKHDELIDQLTMAGFHVSESIPIFNKFNNIVIGKIIQCNMHPKIPEARIIQADTGSKDLINIICYDKNCRNNLKVVIANTGSILANGKTVTSININGIQSEGILCTFSMLGLYNYTQGIIILPSDAPIGYNFENYLNLNDNILDITITPNRGDCLSIIGISREIAAINKLKHKSVKINETKFSPKITTDTISVIIENPKACPKFLGRIIKNIDVTVSTPLKIQDKLFRCGINPINLIKDIENYVLLELGQPIHIYDYEKINQNTIYIRSAKPEEFLIISNNKNRNIKIKLSTNTLIIADNQQPLSIAGIIIGNNFNVSNKTRHIFLQSAFFHPQFIVGRSKLYNIDTLSAIRYERGVDPNIAELALNYAISLLLNIFNNLTVGPTTKVINNTTLPKSNIIALNQTALNKILGFHIDKQQVTQILQTLGFKIEYTNTLWKVLPPSWRFDICIKENIISEIIRIHGYNNIPKISANVHLTTTDAHKTDTLSLCRAKEILIDRGYQEVITYSFVNPNIQKILYPNYNPLTLINPINFDMSVMRLSLWPGLIKTVIYNQNRQHKNIRLFESGICFISTNDTYNNKIIEKFMIAGIRSESQFHKYWDDIKSPPDFYDIKGDIEALLSITQNFNEHNILFKNCIHSALHPKKSAAIYYQKALIGYIGVIHPAIQTTLNLHANTLIFELSWNEISKIEIPKFKNISKFPKNYRDISFIIPIKVFAEDVINACKQLNINQVISIKLLDVYTGNNISKGYKSFTIQLILQSNTHTLIEEEISKILNKYTTILSKKFNAIPR